MPLLPKKGSVLVFSLIILSIILSAAITVATVSVTNQRSASSTGKSVQSFQVADSGIELALQKIYKGNYATLNALATGMGGAASCTGGAISKNNVVGGSIKVSFYDNDGNLVTCTDTAWRDKVVRIKSEGAAFGTTRVVETAVAAAGDFTGSYDCTGTGHTIGGGDYTNGMKPRFVIVTAHNTASISQGWIYAYVNNVSIGRATTSDANWGGGWLAAANSVSFIVPPGAQYRVDRAPNNGNTNIVQDSWCEIE